MPPLQDPDTSDRRLHEDDINYLASNTLTQDFSPQTRRIWYASPGAWLNAMRPNTREKFKNYPASKPDAGFLPVGKADSASAPGA
jgi:hypothetical protein